jgi:hypothetical protein
MVHHVMHVIKLHPLHDSLQSDRTVRRVHEAAYSSLESDRMARRAHVIVHSGLLKRAGDIRLCGPQLCLLLERAKIKEAVNVLTLALNEWGVDLNADFEERKAWCAKAC